MLWKMYSEQLPCNVKFVPIENKVLQRKCPSGGVIRLKPHPTKTPLHHWMCSSYLNCLKDNVRSLATSVLRRSWFVYHKNLVHTPLYSWMHGDISALDFCGIDHAAAGTSNSKTQERSVFCMMEWNPGPAKFTTGIIWKIVGGQWLRRPCGSLDCGRALNLLASLSCSSFLFPSHKREMKSQILLTPIKLIVWLPRPRAAVQLQQTKRVEREQICIHDFTLEDIALS